MALGKVKELINDELLRKVRVNDIPESVIKTKNLKDALGDVTVKYEKDKLFAINHLHTEGLVDSISIKTFSDDVKDVGVLGTAIKSGIQGTLARESSIIGDQTDGKTFGGFIKSVGNTDGSVGVAKLGGNFGLTGVTRPNVKCIGSGSPQAIIQATTTVEALVNTTRVDIATFLDSLPEVIGRPAQGFLTIVLKVAKELGITDAIMAQVSPFAQLQKTFSDVLMNSPLGGIMSVVNNGVDFLNDSITDLGKNLGLDISTFIGDTFPSPTEVVFLDSTTGLRVLEGTTLTDGLFDGSIIAQTVPDPTKFNLGGFLKDIAEQTIKEGTAMLHSMVAQELPFGETITLLNALAAGGRQANEALVSITVRDPNIKALILDGEVKPELIVKAVGDDLGQTINNVRSALEEDGTSAATIAEVADALNKNELRIANEFRQTLTAILASDVPSSPLNSDVEIEIGKPFTYVSSTEELDFEMASSIHSLYTSREINNVVIHATETFTNKNIGVEEIEAVQGDIGYHYVIRRDGRLQRGIQLGQSGNHTETGNYNETSIGIAMVGGILSPATEGSWQTSSASFTREQYNTLEQFLGVFYHHVAGGEVFGHNDINPEELDPYFDVQEYILSLFGKVNESFVESPESEQTPIFIPDPTLLNISDIDLKASGKFEVKYAKQNTNKKFVDPDLLRDDIPRRLELIANAIGRNLIVTSGYRTQAQGDAIGSSRKSRHRTGQAVDVSRDGMSNAQLQSLIEAAISAGFRGIGVYNGHLHFDTGTKKCWGPTGSRKSLAGSKFAFARSVLNAFKYTTA